MSLRWNKIRELLEHVLDLPAELRQPMVNSTRSSAEVRDAVAQLVRTHLQSESHPGRLAGLSQGGTPQFEMGQRLLDRYVVKKFIASGASSEVYEVLDTRLGTHVALKALHAHLASSTRYRERLRHELLSVRGIKHPRLCQIYDIGEHVEYARSGVKRTPCLTMELVPGITLEALLTKQRPLEIETARDIVRQVSGAVAALHVAGLVHGDLKPSNILLAPNGERSWAVKVADFGLARSLL